MRDVRPKGRLEWGHGFCPWGSMENGGVIITDFINLKKGKIEKNWKGFNPGLRGEW